jgi:hypothetical protein
MNMPGIVWTPQEAASINEFLSSPVGKKWLGVLMTHKPRVDLSSQENAGMNGVGAAGFEQFLNGIAATRVTREEDMSAAKSLDMTKD